MIPTELFIVLAGVTVILVLSHIIIKNSVNLAKHFNLSGTFIGLTVLSIGTSIPETITHIIGSINILKNPEKINTLSGLVIGSNLGSDIFQQDLLLPIVGMIGTIIIIKKNLFIEVGALIGAAILVLLFSFGNFISRLEGFLLIATYIAYLIYLKKSKISKESNHQQKMSKGELYLALVSMIISFAAMALAADQVLDASITLVERLPISASFFGVIFLGIATALPEFSTSAMALLKGKRDISSGILIGSNITNPLLGIGLGALISTYIVPNVVIFYDLPVKIVTAALIYFFLMKSKGLTKVNASVLIILFLAYLGVRIIFFPTDF